MKKNVQIFKKRLFLQPISQGTIAQLVEQRTENPCVPGSIPGGTTKKACKHQVYRLLCFLQSHVFSDYSFEYSILKFCLEFCPGFGRGSASSGLSLQAPACQKQLIQTISGFQKWLHSSRKPYSQKSTLVEVTDTTSNQTLLCMKPGSFCPKGCLW